jgi:hypothetical protein
MGLAARLNHMSPKNKHLVTLKQLTGLNHSWYGHSDEEDIYLKWNLDSPVFQPAA